MGNEDNDIHDNDDWQKILNSYQIVLEIFKLNNDNYFKRVQVFMSALQVFIAIAFAKVIYPILIPPTSGNRPLDGLFAAAILAVLGGTFALFWRGLSRRQSQYLEFNRRYLRNLERKLQNIGMPLDYFNLESHVFKPLLDGSKKTSAESKKLIKRYATASIFKDTKTGCNYADFNWIPEQPYPETSDDADKLHKIGKVKGGMVRVELDLTIRIAIFWFFLSILCFTGTFWVGRIAPVIMASFLAAAIVIIFLALPLLKRFGGLIIIFANKLAHKLTRSAKTILKKIKEI